MKNIKIFSLLKGLIIVLILGTSGCDDDRAYVPMPEKNYLLTKEGNLLYRNQADLNICSENVSDISYFQDFLWTASAEGLKKTNVRSGEIHSISFDEQAGFPHRLSKGYKYIVTSDTTSDRIVFYSEEKNNTLKKVHTLNGFPKVSEIAFESGKFYVAFGDSLLAILHEEAGAELYRTAVIGKVFRLNTDRLKRVIAVASAGDTAVRTTILDPSGNVSVDKNRLLNNIKDVWFSDYSSRPYEREYTYDITLKSDGIVSELPFPSKEIAVDFAEGTIFSLTDSSFILYDLNRRQIRHTWPLNLVKTGIRKKIDVLMSEKEIH